MLDSASIKLLFVCSRNRLRSRTAEKIYADHSMIKASSAGTSDRARRTIRSADLVWADIVIVMEKRHREQLGTRFPDEMRYKECYVLDIPDDYQFMDPELIQLITDRVEGILGL